MITLSKMGVKIMAIYTFTSSWLLQRCGSLSLCAQWCCHCIFLLCTFLEFLALQSLHLLPNVCRDKGFVHILQWQLCDYIAPVFLFLWVLLGVVSANFLSFVSAWVLWALWVHERCEWVSATSVVLLVQITSSYGIQRVWCISLGLPRFLAQRHYKCFHGSRQNLFLRSLAITCMYWRMRT